MPFLGFWGDFKGPIYGLSPMDGVTDAPYRYMFAKYSQPSVLITEFVNVEGLARGAVKMLRAFEYSDIERPIVAQIYGTEVESYYKVAMMVCHLGFDGIDINMGCPMNKIAKRGSGAGLIGTPELAKQLIRTVKQAVQDYADGKTLEEADIRPKLITALREMRPEEGERKLIPVSVKTRVGIKEEIVEEWMGHLVEEEPAAIMLHGRTLKQLYTGEANWNTIGKAAKIVQEKGIKFLGNGDVDSMEDANKKIEKYGLDGVLVGRATFGDPWFFSGHKSTVEERVQVAIEHAETWERMFPDAPFFPMRKHMAWYMKEFSGAASVRKNLMQTSSSDEVKEILEPLMKG